MKVLIYSLHQNMTEVQFYTMHTGWVHMNISVCQSDRLPTRQKGVTQWLPLMWQTVSSWKFCIFFLDWKSVSLHLSPASTYSPYLHPFGLHSLIKWETDCSHQPDKKWRYRQHELSAGAMYQSGPFVLGCHFGEGMRCENFAASVAWEIRFGWTDTLIFIVSVPSHVDKKVNRIRYQYRTHTKIITKDIKGCPSTSPFEIHMT